ncbi:MAG: DUF58 domain-containing protein [Pirellulaceae bacterium]|nr:DUF58 domain-containing protein [Pirellulaceae bacterium]
MRMVAGIALLLLIGMLTGASMLVYAAYVLIAVYWLTLALSRRWADSLKASRKSSAYEVEIGQSIQVSLKLENTDRWPIVWMLLEDAVPRAALLGPPPALQLEGSNLRLCYLPSRQTKLHSYRLTALRRGYFQIGPLIAETGDLFGLHRRFRTVTKAETLLVLPKIVPLAGYEIASQRPVGEVRVTYRLMEDPTLISGIRKYERGDPMRSVHWRATARTGTLQSKQYQPTSVAGATLVLDLHRLSNPDRHEPIRSDLAVMAAASIAHTLMQMQQQFGLVSNGRDAVDRMAEEQMREYESRASAQRASAMRTRSERLQPVTIPLGRGAEHFMYMHKTLARLERTDGLELPEFLFEIQGRLSRHATVLVIVQQVDEPAALALGMLKRQGYSVSAIVNNYDNDAYTDAVGRLMAQRIGVHHLLDEASIAEICVSLVS